MGEVLGAHPKALPGAVEPHGVVAAYQDGLDDWTHGPVDLSGVVRQVRSWSRALLDEFFPGVVAPEFLFCFAQEGARVLGHYVPGRNDLGLRWEVSINPDHLGLPPGAIAGVLLHELLHWYEESFRRPPRSRNGYHSAWFRSQATAFGIPCSRYGATLGITVSSRFSRWASEHGVALDPSVPLALPEPVSPPAKRVPWVCACPPGTRVSVQVPRASDLRAHCDWCRAPFHRVNQEDI